MKKMLLIGALLASALANAETVLVQQAKGHQCVGDKFPINKPMEVLFKERSCKLPLSQAKDMREYVFRTGAVEQDGRVINPPMAMRGCWGSYLDGSYLIVLSDGSQRVSPPNAYVTASLDGGTATVTLSPNQGTRFAQAMEMCP